jgi:anti-anti-sigma regulatory factor
MKIELSGCYNVDRAAEFLEHVRRAATSGEPIEMDLRDVEDADLSFFQILHAVRKDLGEERLRILPGWNQEMDFKLRLTGFVAQVQDTGGNR